MFSRPKILFLVSLLFVALLNSIPTYLLNFKFFYHIVKCANHQNLCSLPTKVKLGSIDQQSDLNYLNTL